MTNTLNKFLVYITLFLISFPVTFAQDDVSLFNYWKYYSDAENALYKTESGMVLDQLSKRKQEIQKISSLEEWQDRQEVVKEKLLKIIGPFPSKTPLNAKITGKIKRPDFRVEKVVFESMPGFYVTAAIFIPNKRKGKAPAILFASGHTESSFRYKPYQQIIINLVKKGFVVLAIDPVGQSERSQYLDPATGKPLYGSVAEHCYFGNQCFLSGYSPAKYFIWDGIRAIDYLISRKEVDPERIGITGHSGGGTQTAYIAAIDDRILAAVPECFITDLNYLIKSNGPQDAEQNLSGFTQAGLNHADFIEVRAPKPTLILSVTRDFFSIQGARETYAESKMIYKAYGKDDYIQMSESDTIHGTPLKNREARYAFFQKFLDLPGDPKDHKVQFFSEQELWVTETGQLATSFIGKTVFDLNKDVATKQLSEIKISRKNESAHLNEVRTDAKMLSGFKYPEKYGTSIFSGKYINPDYELEKYLIPGSGDYYLPAVLYKPAKNDTKKLIILFSDKGKEWIANNSPLAHSLVKQGYSVLLFDLPGIGELGPGYMHGYDAYFPVWYTSILAGTSISGLWAEDILRAVHFAKSRIPGSQITGISDGNTSTGLLLASVFSTEISKIIMIKPLIGYEQILTNIFYDEKLIPSSIAGALNSFDLPDLYALLAPRKTLLVNPVNGTDKPATKKEIDASLSFVTKIYTGYNAQNGFNIITDLEISKISNNIFDWLK